MNTEIAKEIQSEQDSGRQKYGGDSANLAHDDGHSRLIWSQCIENHCERSKFEAPREWRQRMVKIAGLAVSAIESFDRIQSRQARTIDECCNQPEGAFAQFCKDHPDPDAYIAEQMVEQMLKSPPCESEK